MSVTAINVLASMGTGCNLGNTLDTATNSRDPIVVTRRLKALRVKGFRHVRIPVTWRPVGATVSRIDSNEFTRLVDGAVDAALRAGFVVILNAHHEEWLRRFDGSRAMSGEFRSLWVKIATRYKNKSQRSLIFEILNEPQIQGSRSMELTRELNRIGFDAVRSVSKQRVVFIQPCNKGDSWACRGTYPSPAHLPGGGTDAYLAVTAHSYPPYSLPAGDTGDVDEAFVRTRIDNMFKELVKFRTTTRVPVHLGEFGIGRTKASDRDSPLVHLYYRTVAKMSKETSIPICAWDDGTDGYFRLSSFDVQAMHVTFPFDLAGDILKNNV